MQAFALNRRALLKAAAALAATALYPTGAHAQTGRRQTGGPLPARGEFVIRNAIVLSMDPRVADLPRGAVHVRDGAIVAVATDISAPGAASIDAEGMICMPGFIDTH